MKLLGRAIGGNEPIFVIAGPCVIETETLCLKVAERLRRIADKFGILVIFKASFDKANRSGIESYRGPGLDKGLRILERVRQITGLPIVTDVHDNMQAVMAGQVCDMLQTPAFLCRQTDFIQWVASQGLPVNIKKGQWMMPGEMRNVLEKCAAVHNREVLFCERGTHFGHGDLVVDMRGLPEMTKHAPVVFDATHSVQKPGALGNKSGGDRAMAPVLARAAVAAGVAGVFMETHPSPDFALSDGPNMIPLDHVDSLVETLIRIDAVTKGYTYGIPDIAPSAPAG